MKNHWDNFFEQKIGEMFSSSKTIIDIGGGLRIDGERNNRIDPSRSWILELIKKNSVDYKILDKVPEYHPDIVGDIHNLPFADNSVDAIVCIAILEHIEEPQKAVREIYRVLKPGGQCFIYAPFLYYYHPMKGYYQDFYRFTRDGMEYMCKDFSKVETANVRGALETVANLLPFLSKKTGFLSRVDRWLRKSTSNQTSGFHTWCVK